MNIYRKPTVEWYKSQVGYEAGANKSNKYFAALDSVNWYNYKKNNQNIDWCCGFYDCGIYENSDPKTNDARAIVFEPSRDNCGAACTFKVNYFKNNGAWYGKMSDAQIGDEIFFCAEKYKKKENPYGVYHTGAVVDWDSKGIYTVEGNTNGGKVASKFYAYGDSKVLGFGRPKWTADEPPTPEPIPEPTPSEQKYIVRVKTYLTIRNGAGTSYNEVGRLFNGAIVSVDEKKDGFGRISGESWVSLKYIYAM